MRLLPCPFCGRDPEVSDRAASPGTGHAWVWFVFCHCGGYSARAHQYGHSQEEVAKKWNKRWEAEAHPRG